MADQRRQYGGGALLIAAHRLGVTEDFASYERVSEIPFSAKSRQMTVNCVKGKERWTFVKGAPKRSCSAVIG